MKSLYSFIASALMLGVFSARSAEVGLRIYWPHEITNFVAGDVESYPVSYKHVGMLQFNCDSFSEEVSKQVREKLKTNGITEESIFVDIPLDKTLQATHEGVITRLEKGEKAGWEWGDLIVYREALFDFNCKDQDLFPGPWSDLRMLSVDDITNLRARLKAAHETGRLKRADYKLCQLIHCWRNIGEPEKDFLLKHMDGLYVEVNTEGGNWISHGKRGIANHEFERGRKYEPYEFGDTGSQDCAEAVAWAVRNDFHVGFSSGSNVRDIWFREMFEDLTARIVALGVDPSDDRISYLLHHNRNTDDDVMPYFPEDDEDRSISTTGSSIWTAATPGFLNG